MYIVNFKYIHLVNNCWPLVNKFCSSRWVISAFFDELVFRGGKNVHFSPPPEKSKNILIKYPMKMIFLRRESMKQNTYILDTLYHADVWFWVYSRAKGNGEKWVYFFRVLLQPFWK